MKQADFADEVGVSRETVSHWENVNEAGEPRQKTTRRNANALAHVARELAGWNVDTAFFYAEGETAFDQVLRELKNLNTTLGSRLDKIEERLTDNAAPLSAKNDSAGFAAGGSVAQRFEKGDIVGWRDHTFRPTNTGCSGRRPRHRNLDFDATLRRTLVDPRPHGYWRARIADEATSPTVPPRNHPTATPPTSPPTPSQSAPRNQSRRLRHASAARQSSQATTSA